MADEFKFKSQQEAIANLETFSKQDKHSIIISGPSGCGKTYLAKKYAKMLRIPDVVICNAKVSDIKSTMDQALSVENDILVCLENIDTGVVACAHVLLKCMEEPRQNIYIVVTCNNLSSIPDTLISRSMVVNIAPPTKEDIYTYCSYTYPRMFKNIKDSTLYSCIGTFAEADEVFNMSSEHRMYFNTYFSSMKVFNDSISNISWKLGHFDDNTEIKSNILIKYIMTVNGKSKHVVRSCRECMDELDKKRMSRFLVLSKLAFDLKYCE